MKVVVARSAGFCWGVHRAVKRARQLARNGDPPVFTDGPLIHNEQMMARLREEGIQQADDVESLRSGCLVIRAHGIPPARRALLDRLPVHVEDATCPDVARIQSLVGARAARGCHVLIFGDAGHAEVVGLDGFAAGLGHVVSGPEDIAGLPAVRPVCLVAQSTQFPARYDEVAKAARERFPDIEVLDTICPSTKSRQREVEDMAAKVDAFVVVGGAHSANTVRLVELARRFKPTVHLQAPDQVRASDFDGVSTVGLTAGASTPSFIIEQVKASLERIPFE